MWDFDSGTLYNTDDFINLIKQYKDRVEGVTWLGGEPLEQIEAVTEISRAVQSFGLSVIVFTGYEYKNLEQRADFQELIKYVDILIDGRYEQDKTDYSRPWVGSSNQNYYFLSNRYDENIITTHKNKIEIRVDKNNNISLNGMGNFKKVLKTMQEV